MNKYDKVHYALCKLLPVVTLIDLFYIIKIVFIHLNVLVMVKYQRYI